MNVQKRFENLTEVFGWLQIAASPFLACLGIGTIIYVYQPDSLGLIIGISFTVLGLIVGVIWATRVWRKKGTMWFLSRIISTPDIDNYNKGADKTAIKKKDNR